MKPMRCTSTQLVGKEASVVKGVRGLYSQHCNDRLDGDLLPVNNCLLLLNVVCIGVNFVVEYMSNSDLWTVRVAVLEEVFV